MNIRNNIKSSLTVGLLTFSLIFGLSIVAFGADDTQNVGATVTKLRTITAPVDVTDLTAVRGSTGATGQLTLDYTSDYAALDGDDEITVEVTSTPAEGNEVAGSILNVQGGSLGTGSWSELWNPTDGAGSAQILKSSFSSAQGTISDIKFQLDASSVSPGTANIGSQMSFTVTYTIQSA